MMTQMTSLLVLVAVLVCSHAQFDQDQSSKTIVNSTNDIELSIRQEPNTQDLNVYAIPVGQGDCTIIQCPNGNIVVLDCGSSGGNRVTPQQIQDALGDLINQVVAVIITHPDSDHFNYLYQINWNLDNIRAVIIGGVLDDYNRPRSPKFDEIYNWLLRFGGRLATVNNRAGMLPCIGDCTTAPGTNFCENQNIVFNILAANIGPSSNEKSIVMKVIMLVNQWSILLPGDIEGGAANTIATDPGVRPQLHSTVYKIAHHGASRLANSQVWLDPIKPMHAFASSGYNFGSCRHPRCETINRLNTVGTIAMAPPHAFYCGNPRGVMPMQYEDFTESIFETSPNSNTICLLTYTSAGMGKYDCNQILQPTNDFGDDEDCPDEDEEINGAVTAVANYSVFLSALFCLALKF